MIYEPKFLEFQARCQERLAKGQREYKDQSFFQPVPKLMEEVDEELLDVAIWAFIAWCRWQETKDKQRRIGVA